MKRALSFLGILNRGGNLIIGMNVLYAHKGALLIVAKDASEGSKKKLRDFASRLCIPLSETFSQEELGSALGYEKISCALLSSRHEANAYLAKLEAND